MNIRLCIKVLKTPVFLRIGGTIFWTILAPKRKDMHGGKQLCRWRIQLLLFGEQGRSFSNPACTASLATTSCHSPIGRMRGVDEFEGIAVVTPIPLQSAQAPCPSQIVHRRS